MLLPYFHDYRLTREPEAYLSTGDRAFLVQYEEHMQGICAHYLRLKDKEPYSHFAVAPDFRQGEPESEMTVTVINSGNYILFLQTFHNALKNDMVEGS